MTPKSEEASLKKRDTHLVFTDYLQNVDMANYKLHTHAGGTLFACCAPHPAKFYLK